MIAAIISGILAGYVASKIQRGRGMGCLVNLVLGIVGGILGNVLFGLFGLSSTGWLGDFIVSVVGAVVLLWIVAKLR